MMNNDNGSYSASDGASIDTSNTGAALVVQEIQGETVAAKRSRWRRDGGVMAHFGECGRGEWCGGNSTWHGYSHHIQHIATAAFWGFRAKRIDNMPESEPMSPSTEIITDATQEIRDGEMWARVLICSGNFRIATFSTMLTYIIN